jgi:hydrogenase maturation factor
MYKQDKVGVDVRIDGMTAELSHDIEHMKKIVEARKKAYEEAHEAAIKAMRDSY